MPARQEFGMAFSSIPGGLRPRTRALLLAAKVAKTSGGPGMAEKLKGLAAARSRRGSDTTPWCHSTPRRRFATPTPPVSLTQNWLGV